MLTHAALLSQSQLRSFPFLVQRNGVIVMEKVGAGKLHPVSLHGTFLKYSQVIFRQSFIIGCLLSREQLAMNVELLQKWVAVTFQTAEYLLARS